MTALALVLFIPGLIGLVGLAVSAAVERWNLRIP